MFTGLIEETGILERAVPSASEIVLQVRAKLVLEGIRIGDSVAVNGVCLTVVDSDTSGFAAQAVQETVENSTIPDWRVGEVLNLERALAVGDRLGGHIVQGHVDGIGTVKSIRAGELETVISVSAPSEIMKYIVRKGSIAIDGISLTVAQANGDVFTVAIIPHTWGNTNLTRLSSGSQVNLETDVLARYVEKFFTDRELQSSITEKKLREAGF